MQELARAVNRQSRLAARPVGLPKDADWQFTEEPVSLPAEGGVLVRTLYLSLDPAMRGWMNEGKSYIPPVGIGEVMRAGGIGVVVASKNPAFAVGENDLWVIEDAAEALGAEYLSQLDQPSAWKRCGGMGDLSCFSFYANKLITTGEGGMVLTNDPELYERLKSLRNLCFRPERRFYHTHLGYNYRMTNLQAALGLAQLERFDQILEKKRWMGKAYTDRLSGIPMIQLPVEESWAKQVYWMFGLVLDENTGMDAEEFARRLKQQGVSSRSRCTCTGQ